MSNPARKRSTPEKTLLNSFIAELKSDLSSARRDETLAMLVRLLSLYLQEAGRPTRWSSHERRIAKEGLTTGFVERKRLTGRRTIPKEASKIIRVLLELANGEAIGETSGWIVDLMATTDSILEGELMAQVNRWNKREALRGLLLSASKNLRQLLEAGATSSVKRVSRFGSQIIPSYANLIENELSTIKANSLTRLPEVSRTFLADRNSSFIGMPTALLSDPSQSVETQQLAQLLQSSWIRFDQAKLDKETYEGLLSFCMGFKHLELHGAKGDIELFSREFYEGDFFLPGQKVVVEVPPVIWRSSDKLRVIVKGTAVQYKGQTTMREK